MMLAWLASTIVEATARHSSMLVRRGRLMVSADLEAPSSAVHG
jgi:hypothetical protein